MRISFIIPCYNVSKTVRRCLDSIYALPLREEEFEVITVNDASTDDTLQILQEYGNNHPNLMIVNHLVNRNLGAARNSGMAVAKGNCIAFVDSDDEVGPGIVNALKRMEAENLDMVAMRLEIVSEDGTVIRTRYLPYDREEVFEGKQMMVDHPFWSPEVTVYLWRRSFLLNVKYAFVEGLFFEDTDFTNTHLFFARRVGYCDICGYHYYQTQGSIMHTHSFKHLAGIIMKGARLLSLYERMDDKASCLAQSVLEAGSYKMYEGFRQMVRLHSVEDVRAFYNLVDTRIDRKTFLKYKNPAYCWNLWTRVCLKHRMLATGMTRILSPGLVMRRKLRNALMSH